MQEDVAVSPMKKVQNFFLRKNIYAAKTKPEICQLISVKSNIAFPDYLPDSPPIPPEDPDDSDISLTDVSSLGDEDNDFSTILNDFPEVSSKVSSLVADDASNEDGQTSLELNPQFTSTPAKQALIPKTDSGFHNESTLLISTQINNPPPDCTPSISDGDFLKIADLEWLNRLLSLSTTNKNNAESSNYQLTDNSDSTSEIFFKNSDLKWLNRLFGMARNPGMTEGETKKQEIDDIAAMVTQTRSTPV